MRVGTNPNRKAKVSNLARVVVLVITHLPDLTSEYHKHRLEVVKHSLKTLTHNINMKPEDYDLIVWDNGSCQELREWLDTWVCKRFFSCNIGKRNAQKLVMRMVPEGTILAYGDDDMEYMPNWLKPQIQILKTFPSVGTVTGWPVRVTGKWGETTTLNWAKRSARVDVGKVIPTEWERDYCNSIELDWSAYCEMVRGTSDTMITYKGVQALAMSQHCQFVCYPERVERLMDWTDEAMLKEAPFDRAVDEAGLLRLATVERYTRHIGNVMEKERVNNDKTYQMA